MLREVQELQHNIEHVKEIVVVQQTYARQCGVLETVAIAELVEDALRRDRVKLK